MDTEGGSNQFPHVALPLSLIDRAMSQNVLLSEGEHRMARLRPVVVAAGWSQILETVVQHHQTPHTNQARIALLKVNHEVLSPEEADDLTEEKRAQCRPIAFTAEVASPLAKTVPRDSNIRITLGATLKVRIFKKLHAQHGKTNICAVVTYESGEKRVENATVDSLLVDKLFEIPKRHIVPKKKQHTARDGGNGYFCMPDLLCESFAGILQDHLRLHVLMNAALPEGKSRPLAINQLIARQSPSTGMFCLMTDVHEGTVTCICPAHGRRVATPAAGSAAAASSSSIQKDTVRIFFAFCGAQTDSNGKCSRHTKEGVAPQDAHIGGVCIAGHSLAIKCTHADGSSGSCINIPIPESALPPLFVLAAACVSLSKGQSVENLEAKLEDCENEAERLRCEKPSTGHASSTGHATPERDRVCLHVLRSQRIARSSNEGGSGFRLVSRLGNSAVCPNVHKLAATYGHLFPVKFHPKRKS